MCLSDVIKVNCAHSLYPYNQRNFIMHKSQIEKFNETLLGPMVGIGVNEETYAQP